ncbi:MAG: hypothetical protein NTY99_01055, partial [DPANN group archaeon]|nr:hypothetical protein [DPANN group archaeon]
MTIEIKEGETNYFCEPYMDMQSRWRTKIVCIAKAKGGFYAYGSAVWSFDDRFNQWAGENIAYQRAEKVLRVFGKYQDANATIEALAKTTIPRHMRLLSTMDFEDLEGKLLPFRDPSQPKDAQNKESADANDEY